MNHISVSRSSAEFSDTFFLFFSFHFISFLFLFFGGGEGGGLVFGRNCDNLIQALCRLLYIYVCTRI